MLSVFGLFYIQHFFNRIVDENLSPKKLLKRIEPERNSALTLQQFLELGKEPHSLQVRTPKYVPQHPGPEMVKTKQVWTQPQIDYSAIGKQRALESYMNGVEADIVRRQEETNRIWRQEVYRLQQLEEFKRQIAPPSPIQPPIPPPAAGGRALQNPRVTTHY